MRPIYITTTTGEAGYGSKVGSVSHEGGGEGTFHAEADGVGNIFNSIYLSGYSMDPSRMHVINGMVALLTGLHPMHPMHRKYPPPPNPNGQHNSSNDNTMHNPNSKHNPYPTVSQILISPPIPGFENENGPRIMGFNPVEYTAKWSIKSVDTGRWRSVNWKGFKFISDDYARNTAKIDKAFKEICSSFLGLNIILRQNRFEKRAWDSYPAIYFVQDISAKDLMFALQTRSNRTETKRLDMSLAHYEKTGELKLGYKVKHRTIEETRRVKAQDTISMQFINYNYANIQTRLGDKLVRFETRMDEIFRKDSPFVLVYSLMDNQGLLMECAVIEDDPIFQDTCLAIDSLSNIVFNYNHNVATPFQEVCNNPACSTPRALYLTCKDTSKEAFEYIQTFEDYKYVDIDRRVQAERMRLWKEEFGQVVESLDFKDPDPAVQARIYSLYKLLDLKCAQFGHQLVHEHDCKTWARCSRCKKAQYCSRTCQEKDYKRHKPVCHPPRE